MASSPSTATSAGSTVRLGDRVLRAALIGVLGKTGRTAEPALYFEVRVRGAAVDPLGAMPKAS